MVPAHEQVSIRGIGFHLQCLLYERLSHPLQPFAPSPFLEDEPRRHAGIEGTEGVVHVFGQEVLFLFLHLVQGNLVFDEFVQVLAPDMVGTVDKGPIEELEGRVSISPSEEVLGHPGLGRQIPRVRQAVPVQVDPFLFCSCGAGNILEKHRHGDLELGNTRADAPVVGERSRDGCRMPGTGLPV